MGANFYMITKNKEIIEKYAPYSYNLTDTPDWGYEIHVAKRSGGWLPLFQGHKDGIISVAGYKEAYDTGEFNIYDEYGCQYTWKEFDENVLQWNGGKLGVMKPKKPYRGSLNIPTDYAMPEYIPVSHIPGSKQSYRYRYYEEYRTIFADPEGYEFEMREFS